VNRLHNIAFSPEGRHLAVCNPNGAVYILRLAKRGEVFKVKKQSGMRERHLLRSKTSCVHGLVVRFLIDV
jgi:hypothetical protein